MTDTILTALSIGASVRSSGYEAGRRYAAEMYLTSCGTNTEIIEEHATHQARLYRLKLVQQIQMDMDMSLRIVCLYTRAFLQAIQDEAPDIISASLLMLFAQDPPVRC